MSLAKTCFYSRLYGIWFVSWYCLKIAPKISKNWLYILAKFLKSQDFKNLQTKSILSICQKWFKKPSLPWLTLYTSSGGKIPRFTKSDHDALAEIFRKIGQKELTKQGLQELYNFKQQNPHADLEPFLIKSSEYFRNYIGKGNPI